MEKKFKYLMMAAIVAAGFSSCNKDDGPNNGGDGNEDNTAMQTIISQAVTTYAADPNAIATEVDFKDATFLFFSTSGLHKKNVEYNKDRFRQADENTWVSPWIPAETGSNLIYVGLSLPDNMADNIASGGVYAVHTLLNPNEIYKDNEFSMFSKRELNITLVDDSTANKHSAYVDRMAAKISVMKKDGLNTRTEHDAVEFYTDKITYAMGGLNTKIYAFQKNENGKVVDPNYRSVLNQAGDNVENADEFVTEFRNGNDIAYNNFVDANAASVVVANRTKKYAPENTSETNYRGELTYATVQVAFLPDSLHSYTGGNLTIAKNSASTWQEVDYHVVKTFSSEVQREVFYFFAEDKESEAAAYANYLVSEGKSAEKLHYKKGYCYYYLLVNKSGSYEGGQTTETYNVLRNEYYQITINKISNFGNPDPEITKPWEPGTQDTEMEITVYIEPWTPVTEEQPLER